MLFTYILYIIYCDLYLVFWPPVTALDLYTITGRMRKHNLKYYSAPRDSDQDLDMSFRSKARYSLHIFWFHCNWPSVPALELYTITGRMRKHNLKYYSAPRDSDQDHDMSFRSEAWYSLHIFRFHCTWPSVPALDLYTITGRMRKQNLKYCSVMYRNDISWSFGAG